MIANRHDFRLWHKCEVQNASAARELGILTIGVVTKPFRFEGQRRMRFAKAGIAELLKVADTLLVIPNQNLFRVAN
jgi:cell division protein FtsZ